MKETYEDIVREWYNKVRPLFVNTLKKRFTSLSYDDIEDLYQQAFLAVHDNLQAGRVREDTSWSSYIIQIGLNLASKDMRHLVKTDSIDSSSVCDEDGVTALQRQVENLLAVNASSDKSAYADADVQKVLGEELGFTPEPCSTIIRLFYFDNMSMEDIAIAVNMKNSATAKSKKHQCMKTLKDRVKRALARIGYEC